MYPNMSDASREAHMMPHGVLFYDNGHYGVIWWEEDRLVANLTRNKYTLRYKILVGWKSIECKFCYDWRQAEGPCDHCGALPLPEYYAACGDCGFDHTYEPLEATTWHTESGDARVCFIGP